MLPHVIVKREKLAAMLKYARRHRKPEALGWGALSRLGTTKVSDMYWKDGMTQDQIGVRCGVTRGAVAQFMLRRQITGRPPGPKPGKK
jgi:DNA-binding XRE family transcriptional regulator